MISILRQKRTRNSRMLPGNLIEYSRSVLPIGSQSPNFDAGTLLIIFRAPLEDSRKWGIYYIINLLFKTYFKLNSISLSKNILKAIQAFRGDMPNLDVFPMSHQVTFKYYVGVIYFLEENYVEVCCLHHPITITILIPLPFSPKRTSPKPGTSVTRMQHAIKSQFDTTLTLTPSHPLQAGLTDHP
jgi:hypothetical protein